MRRVRCRGYCCAQGKHALVYDMGTAQETWEWVNLKEVILIITFSGLDSLILGIECIIYWLLRQLTDIGITQSIPFCLP